MNYPLELRFKVIALASQISVVDASGQELYYIKQKLFKFREAIEIYSDSSKSQLVARISANKIIDWSAAYTLTDAQGQTLGVIKRKGARSLWRASYDIELGGREAATVRETNPWSKVADGLFGEIPFIGLLAGYLFHPRYAVISTSRETLVMLDKQPALFESKYIVTNENAASLPENEQKNLVLLLMMVTLLERSRG